MECLWAHVGFNRLAKRAPSYTRLWYIWAVREYKGVDNDKSFTDKTGSWQYLQAPPIQKLQLVFKYLIPDQYSAKQARKLDITKKSYHPDDALIKRETNYHKSLLDWML